MALWQMSLTAFIIIANLQQNNPKMFSQKKIALCGLFLFFFYIIFHLIIETKIKIGGNNNVNVWNLFK